MINANNTETKAKATEVYWYSKNFYAVNTDAIKKLTAIFDDEEVEQENLTITSIENVLDSFGLYSDADFVAIVAPWRIQSYLMRHGGSHWVGAANTKRKLIPASNEGETNFILFKWKRGCYKTLVNVTLKP